MSSDSHIKDKEKALAILRNVIAKHDTGSVRLLSSKPAR